MNRRFIFAVGLPALLASAVVQADPQSQSQSMPWPSWNGAIPSTTSSSDAANDPPPNSHAQPALGQPGSVNTGSSMNAAQGINMAEQSGIGYLINKFKSSNMPEWMKRTDVEFDTQEGYKPVTSIETIQPIYLKGGNTWFWQGRVAYSSADETYNLGAGYRYLLNSKNWMWGVNTFYDQTQRYTHQRIGLGGELFGRYFTFRANYYDAVSGKKDVGMDSSGTVLTERALSGWDYSIETPVPALPWVRLTAQEYHWKGDDLANINGTSFGFITYPFKRMEVDFGLAHDNSLGQQAYLKASYYLDAPDFIVNSASTTPYISGFVPRDLEQLRLQKVLRQNDIIVEKGTVAGEPGIIIARGT